MSSYYNLTAKKNSKEYHEYIIELNNKRKEDAKIIKTRLSDKVFDVLEILLLPFEIQISFTLNFARYISVSIKSTFESKVM